MTRRKSALVLVLLFAVSLGGAFASDAEETEYIKTIMYEDRVMFVYIDYLPYQEYISRAANTLLTALPGDLNKYMMIVPSRISFEVEELRNIAADGEAAMRYVAENLDPSIVYINASDALRQYTGSLNDIFFRLDHHWTHLGAYYAAEAFMAAAGIEQHTLDEYLVLEGEPFAGYMYLISGDETLFDYPDPLTYYMLPGSENKTADVYYPAEVTEKPAMETVPLIDLGREGYAAFVDDFGFSQAIIPGDETAERTLLLIGGSSSYSLATWLADNFKTVVLLETRYYEGGEEGILQLIQEYGITDVLLCVSFSTYIV
jgi:hypothetical protein